MEAGAREFGKEKGKEMSAPVTVSTEAPSQQMATQPQRRTSGGFESALMKSCDTSGSR